MIRDAELNLLVDLCARAIRGERSALAVDNCDWSRLLHLARRHRVQGLAWLGLTDGTESGVPEAEIQLPPRAVPKEG